MSHVPPREDGHEGSSFQPIRRTLVDNVMQFPIEYSGENEVGTNEVIVQVTKDAFLAPFQNLSVSLVHYDHDKKV